MEGDSRALLNWGMSAIDKLADEVKDTRRENASLTRRMQTLRSSASAALPDASRELTAHETLTLTGRGADIVARDRPMSAVRMSDLLKALPTFDSCAQHLAKQAAHDSSRSSSTIPTAQSSPAHPQVRSR